MKITDKRVIKPCKFGDVIVGDIFCSNSTLNIFIKTNYGYGNTNAFCLNKNEECRLMVNDEISLLDAELIISN